MESKSDKQPSRTYLINGDYIKFHTVFPGGQLEIVDEYNLYSGEIESRKVKSFSQTGKEVWVTEIGDTSLQIKDKDDNFIIKESSVKNPIFIRKDSKTCFQFRIRNMPWEASNYQIDYDAKSDEIIVKTLNKKYYKRFTISDLKRSGLKIDPKNISVEYMNNTLIVSYTKPDVILKEEKKTQDEIVKIRQEIKENPNKKYDPGCQHQ